MAASVPPVFLLTSWTSYAKKMGFPFPPLVGSRMVPGWGRYSGSSVEQSLTNPCVAGLHTCVRAERPPCTGVRLVEAVPVGISSAVGTLETATWNWNFCCIINDLLLSGQFSVCFRN